MNTGRREGGRKRERTANHRRLCWIECARQFEGTVCPTPMLLLVKHVSPSLSLLPCSSSNICPLWGSEIIPRRIPTGKISFDDDASTSSSFSSSSERAKSVSRRDLREVLRARISNFRNILSEGRVIFHSQIARYPLRFRVRSLANILFPWKYDALRATI